MALPSSAELIMISQFQQRLPDLNFDIDNEASRMVLVRFLRARNHNLNKAEDMLRKHFEWHKENRMDTILQWQAPQGLVKEFRYDLVSFDKEGCPVLINAFGSWDIRGACESGLKQELIRYVDQMSARLQEEMRRSSEIMGRPVTQFVSILVADEFNPFRQISSSHAPETLLEFVRRFEANSPETLKAAFIIDAPKVFSLIYNVVKPLLNSTTLGKVTISSDPNEWKPTLRALIDEDQLCPRLGGTRLTEIPILNTKCKSDSTSEDTLDLVATKIGVGRTFRLEQEIVDEGDHEVSWAFKTDNHDIGFSVVLEKANEVEVIVPHSRVNSDKEMQCGSIRSMKPGKYALIFDNKFSRFRSKTLSHKCVVLPAQNDVATDPKISQ